MQTNFGLRRSAAVLLVAALLGSCTGDEPTPVPTPTATPTEAAEQPTRFEVRLDRISALRTDNSRIYGRMPSRRTKAVNKAGRDAVRQLRAYLDTAFVDADTRGTPAGIRGLLTGRAHQGLDDRDRRALGVGLPPIAGGRTGDARARAMVLFEGGTVHAVTVQYQMRMSVSLPGESFQPLRQKGTMVFLETKKGLRADMVDVTLEAPGMQR